MAVELIRIATRESPLALWQAEYVKARLIEQNPGLRVELIGMTTRGDIILDSPLSKIGGKALFVKELEVALLEKRADIAVHSMKDVPMSFPQGLGLAVICEREDPSDAFVSNTFERLDALPQGARVGTSSLRRQCQLRALRPDLQIGAINRQRPDAADKLVGLIELEPFFHFADEVRHDTRHFAFDPPLVAIQAVDQPVRDFFSCDAESLRRHPRRVSDVPVVVGDVETRTTQF